MTTATNKLLSFIEVKPKTPAIGTIIWLHGLGADGNDFAPIVRELNVAERLPLHFIFPHAPMRAVTINSGYVMRAWYDIVSTNIDSHADQQGIDESVAQLQLLIENEINSGIPSEKIILAGFSQGAVIALTTGLTYADKLGGILALSGYLPNPEQALQFAAPANKHTPIFLGHGTEDNIVPHNLGEKLYTALKEHRFPVSWHSYAMSHSVCYEEIQDIAKWLIGIFAEE